MESCFDPPSDDVRQRLRAERTRQVYSLARFGQPMGVIAAAVLAMALAYAGGTRWLFAWTGAEIAVLVGEVIGWRAFRKATPEAQGGARWERLLAVACLLFGGLWALLPLTMMPAQPTLQLVTVITLVGVTTATIGALGVSTTAFYAYVAPTMLGLVLACMLRGNFDNLLLGSLIVVYMVFLGLVQRTISSQFVERVRTRIQNEDLLAQLQRTEAALKMSLAEHELLFDMAAVGIAEIRDNRIVRTNARLEQMLDYEGSELLGRPPDVLYPADFDPVAVAHITETLARGQAVDGDVRVARRDGGVLWVGLACRPIDPLESSRGVIAVFNDITDRREREAAMQRLAHEDPLTGLPNRRLLEDRLQHALQLARRHDGQVALLLLDLDGFKKINDGHGHEVGDHVLTVVARRLQASVRASDTVSRLGGDEFVVLLEHPIAPGDAGRLAEKLVAAVSERIPLGAESLRVGASVGISVAPQDGSDGGALLRCADDAMYRAKQAGRGTGCLHGQALPAPSPRQDAARVA